MTIKRSISFGKNLAAGLVCAGMISGVAQADEGSEPELLETMSMLQTMAHKSSLAIDHENSALLDFYAHELEEYIEKAESIESYDGKPIGQLVKGMLAPKFKEFKSAAEGGNWDNISSTFDGMIDSCNSCHQATGYNFINIKRTDKNPYMQSFESDN